MGVQTPEKTSQDIKTIFSLDSDNGVEKSCFFNVKLKFLMNNFNFFSVS